MIPNRERALEILKEYTKSEALLRHAYAVEGVMRRFAESRGEDAELWGAVGLLHDLDYERYPDRHCEMTGEILTGLGVDGAFVRACVSHGYGVCSDVEPIIALERTLFAIDELTGLIGAAALMRPSRSVMDLEPKSVMKKFKTPTFAAGCDRELIRRGCEALGLSVEDAVAEAIAGMRDVHEAIGL